VLTLRSGIRLRSANERLHRWIKTVERDEAHLLSWVAILELGELNSSPHFHVLIAGITTRLPRYFELWEEIAGFAKLKPFRREHRGPFTTAEAKEERGVAYALKSLESDDYKMNLDLHDEHLLPSLRGATESQAVRPVLRLRKPQDGRK
jgi:hypothetical protein